LPIRIESKQFGISSLSDDLIENDKIYLTNKAQILNIQFEINGMFSYTSISMQMNTEEVAEGQINGFFIAINKKNASDGGQVVMLSKTLKDSALAKMELTRCEL